MIHEPKRLKVKGPKEGYCAICQQYCTLTYDHIPPKGCVTINPIEIRTLAQEFYGKETKPIISQNGVKFRTLCEICNNKWLGLNYDLELKGFSDEVSLFLKAKVDAKLHFPPQQSFEIKTQKIVRAVVGHSLAAFMPEDISQPDLNTPFYDALRSYFLDDTLPIPDKLKIFYWLFPIKTQIHIRGFGVSSFAWKGTIVGDLFKFFPLAYWLTWDIPKSTSILQAQFGLKKDMSINDEETISIDFQKIPRSNWPEAPGKNEFILLNDQYSSFSKFK
jgi:hypothetical protein